MAVLNLDVERPKPDRRGQSSHQRRLPNRRGWKTVEREVARWIGAERVPVSGRARGYAPDAEHPWLAPEIKLFAEYPVRIAKAMDQAVKAAQFILLRRGIKRLPVVIIHASNHDYGNSLLVMRLKDAEEWFGVRSSKPPVLEVSQEPTESE